MGNRSRVTCCSAKAGVGVEWGKETLLLYILKGGAKKKTKDGEVVT
jgi:hypothetical protein